MENIDLDNQVKLDLLLMSRLRAQEFATVVRDSLEIYRNIALIVLDKIGEEAEKSASLEEFTLALEKSVDILTRRYKNSGEKSDVA